MSVGSDVGYAVGIAGVVLATTRYWIDQRRALPIVICHEDQKRRLREGRFVAEAHITNEIAASAFNIRFGVRVGGVYAPWTHSHEDDESGRINVLRPNERHPEKVPVGIVIPDDVVMEVARDGDPDDGRLYWGLLLPRTSGRLVVHTKSVDEERGFQDHSCTEQAVRTDIPA
jgi:hypothetical protein